ncbi:MAG: hypothetical protein A3A82_00220 [Candidatus Pacebacteria bacterium RIFCSPLOWO2_01_FULL_47_12]|nr:MAG: hypothetical protein A3J60_02755 [Candidatus Pacebacteria bacterium RIFCSPHIGHO2_02_FULL_46_9]OGJ39217.1 MAG: hypothetical protein A3A82_00220 [Candidatus Pacebacteria bacterium RIFCSPLOWO2_01_FULL_47_12]
MVVLDTSIIIDHLRLQERQPSYLEQLLNKFSQEELGLSVISLQELFEGQSTRGAKGLSRLKATIQPLTVLEYTTETAKLAGELARDLPTQISFADAAIAATALQQGCELATLNNKHFLQIPRLKLVSR